MTTTSRAQVRAGVAQYFGGTTYDPEARAYRGSGPLASYGLSTVRAYQPKRMADEDFYLEQVAGRAMGAAMVVEIPLDTETRHAKPAGTGRKRVLYNTILHVFHFAQIQHAEDAEADVDALVEGIKDLFRQDVTLGMGPGGSNLGVYQSGESRQGIRSRVYPAVVDREKVATYITITFDIEVEIVA